MAKRISEAGAVAAKGQKRPPRDAERTRRAILAAAEKEFAEKALSGARVDAIAERAGTNKQMIYYYFESKEKLYQLVLEHAYGAMRKAERELNLLDLEPLQAIRRLVEFKCDYDFAHPRFIRLLAVENLQNAAFLVRSQELKAMHDSLIVTLETILRRGEERGEIKPGIEPLQLYITISSLSYFYMSNAATLSVVFNRDDLRRPDQFALRRTHAIEVAMDFVRPR